MFNRIKKYLNIDSKTKRKVYLNKSQLKSSSSIKNLVVISNYQARKPVQGAIQMFGTI